MRRIPYKVEQMRWWDIKNSGLTYTTPSPLIDHDITMDGEGYPIPVYHQLICNRVVSPSELIPACQQDKMNLIWFTEEISTKFGGMWLYFWIHQKYFLIIICFRLFIINNLLICLSCLSSVAVSISTVIPEDPNFFPFLCGELFWYFIWWLWFKLWQLPNRVIEFKKFNSQFPQVFILSRCQ